MTTLCILFFIETILFSKGCSVLSFAVESSFLLKGILCGTPLYRRDYHETSLVEDGPKEVQSS